MNNVFTVQEYNTIDNLLHNLYFVVSFFHQICLYFEKIIEVALSDSIPLLSRQHIGNTSRREFSRCAHFVVKFHLSNNET